MRPKKATRRSGPSQGIRLQQLADISLVSVILETSDERSAGKIPPSCISAVGAGLYMIWMLVLARAGGPNWVMVPSDLVYSYLFSGLSLLTGHSARYTRSLRSTTV